MNKILIFFVIWGYFHWYPKLVLKSKLTWQESLLRASGLCAILLLVLFIQWGFDVIWDNPLSKVFRKIVKWLL